MMSSDSINSDPILREFLNRVEHQNDPKDSWRDSIERGLDGPLTLQPLYVDRSTNINWNSNNTSVTNVHTDGSSKREQEDKKNKRAIILGIASAALATVYYFSNISDFITAKSNLSQIEYVKDKILNGEGVALEEENRRQLNDIVQVQKDIDARKYYKHGGHTLNAIIGIVSSTLLILGGICAFEAYIAIGSVGLITAVAMSIIHATNHWGDDDANKQDLESNRIVQKAQQFQINLDSSAPLSSIIPGETDK